MFGNKDKELFEMTDIPLAIRDSEIIKKLNDTTEISSSISFREKLKKNCEIYAEKYAFIDEQSHMTYQELKEFSDKLNFILLKKYSLKHGDKVGLYLPKGVEQARRFCCGNAAKGNLADSRCIRNFIGGWCISADRFKTTASKKK